MITPAATVPEPATRFTDVWMASAARAASIWKLIVYDDRGDVEINDTAVVFTGGKHNETIPLSSIRSITIGKQRQPWGSSSIFVALTCLFTIGSGITEGNLAGSLTFAFLFVCFFLLTGKAIFDSHSVSWIVLHCHDVGHSPRDVWLALNPKSRPKDDVAKLRQAIATKLTRTAAT
jgi:hypothetical protein